MVGLRNESVVHGLFLRARGGDRFEVGALLSAYQRHLHEIADRRLDGKLRARLSPSDIVQETMLEAHRDFAQFRGQTEREFAAWLRKILANTLARVIEKHVLTKKRDVRRDVSLMRPASAAESTLARIPMELAARGNTPSFDARHRERADVLANAIAELPESQRKVLLLRNMHGMAFRDIAAQLNRSVPAVKMLWMRAIKQLRKLYEDRDVG